MTVIKRVTNIAVLPVVLAHELTHALVATPWTNKVDITVSGLGYHEIYVRPDWPDDVARWQVALVSFAPFIAGMVALAGALVLWAAGGFSMPTTGTGLAKLSIVAMWWVLYVVPSPADVNTALTGGGGDES